MDRLYPLDSSMKGWRVGGVGVINADRLFLRHMLVSMQLSGKVVTEIDSLMLAKVP